MEAATAAAVASAIAAGFSAIAAVMSWRIQTRTLRENFKPHISIAGWERVPGRREGSDQIRFRSLSNTGRDIASPVIVNCFELADDKRPLFTMSAIHLASLNAGQTWSVEGDITLYWQNAPQAAGGKHLLVNIEITYWDSLRIHHITKVALFVMARDATARLAGNTILPGVVLSFISTKSTPIWVLKLRQRLGWVLPASRCDS